MLILMFSLYLLNPAAIGTRPILRPSGHVWDFVSNILMLKSGDYKPLKINESDLNIDLTLDQNFVVLVKTK